ncbi:MAG: protein phosphatase 2C domain-containing protein [Nocardioides sp.]
MLEFRSSALSHVGLVRSHNEDSGFVGPRLVVVADGMGGAAAGEVASAVAVHAADRECRLTGRGVQPRELLARAVTDAAVQILAAVEADPSRVGMGTTFTALLTDGTRVALAQIGDSRAYRFRAGVLEQVSTDHTLVQSMVDARRMSPAQARRSEHRHIVTRSLGGAGPSDPDLLDLEVRTGDRLLICSDGLSDLVADAALALILAIPGGATVADLLIGAALEAGGTDNVTAVVVDVVDVVPDDLSPHGGTFLGAACLPQPFIG